MLLSFIRKFQVKSRLEHDSTELSLDFAWKDEIRGGADKSLARPTSRCPRTEFTVSLERGVCSYVELQAFSCYRG